MDSNKSRQRSEKSSVLEYNGSKEHLACEEAFLKLLATSTPGYLVDAMPHHGAIQKMSRCVQHQRPCFAYLWPLPPEED